MEIRNIPGPVESIAATQQPKEAQAKAPGAQNPGNLPKDSATLSSAGSFAAQAMTAPDVRMSKVEAVQQALASGTYSVSPDAVAGKLIDHMQSK